MENSCCANYRKKNDTGIHPKCDGSPIHNSDPKICCYGDNVFSNRECDLKRWRCYSAETKPGR